MFNNLFIELPHPKVDLVVRLRGEVFYHFRFREMIKCNLTKISNYNSLYTYSPCER